VLDSGCTNHMTEEKKMFTSFKKNVTSSDSITFGNNSQGKVLGHAKIAITTGHYWTCPVDPRTGLVRSLSQAWILIGRSIPRKGKMLSGPPPSGVAKARQL
jgi:hypothetical protein